MLVPEVLQLSTGPGGLTLELSTRLVTAGLNVTEFSVPVHQMLHTTVGSTLSYGSTHPGSESVEIIAWEHFAVVYMVMKIN